MRWCSRRPATAWRFSKFWRHSWRVIIANPLQVKAIAQAHVKTDKIDAGTLANSQAAEYLPQIWTPDAETERRRRLVAGRYQVVRHRTQLKNEVHSILHAHSSPDVPACRSFQRPQPGVVGRSTIARMGGQPSIGTSVSLIGLRKIWPCSTKVSRRTQLRIPRLTD